VSIETYAKRCFHDIEEAASRLRTTILSGQAHGDRYHALTGELRGLEKAAQILRNQLSPELEPGHPLRKHDTRV
jgi:hypothetical protein